MMRCMNCNRDVEDDAKFCPYCGSRLSYGQQTYSSEYTTQFAQQGSYTSPYNYAAQGNASGYNAQARPAGYNENSVGLDILSFLFPIVGLVLYLSYKDDEPNKAKGVGLCALVSFILGLIGSVFLFGLSALGSAL